MDNLRSIFILGAIFTIFIVLIALILKGLFSPKQSLPDFSTLVTMFKDADTGTRCFMIFMLVWPVGSKKAQMMLVTAVVAIIVAFAKLITPHSHDGFIDKVVKSVFATILKVLRGSATSLKRAGEISPSS